MSDTLTQRLVNAVEYIVYHEENGDYALANDPTKWVEQEFHKWVYKGKQKGKCTAKTTQKEDIDLIQIVSKEGQQEEYVDPNDNNIAITATTAISKVDVNLDLNAANSRNEIDILNEFEHVDLMKLTMNQSENRN